MEWHAIQSLKTKKDTVIIKQANKGSTLTIVSREKYINDGNLHLSDATYSNLDSDPTHKLAADIRTYMQELYSTGFFNKTETEFLSPLWYGQEFGFSDPVQTPYIYFSYRIHKTPISIRPIVSGIHAHLQIPRLLQDHLRNSQSLITNWNTTPSHHMNNFTSDVKVHHFPQDEGIHYTTS